MELYSIDYAYFMERLGAKPDHLEGGRGVDSLDSNTTATIDRITKR